MCAEYYRGGTSAGGNFGGVSFFRLVPKIPHRNFLCNPGQFLRSHVDSQQFFFWRKVLVPLCQCVPPKKMFACIPKYFFVHPLRIPRTVVPATVHKAPKFGGPEIFPTRTPPPPMYAVRVCSVWYMCLCLCSCVCSHDMSVFVLVFARVLAFVLVLCIGVAVAVAVVVVQCVVPFLVDVLARLFVVGVWHAGREEYLQNVVLVTSKRHHHVDGHRQAQNRVLEMLAQLLPLVDHIHPSGGHPRPQALAVLRRRQGYGLLQPFRDPLVLLDLRHDLGGFLMERRDLCNGSGPMAVMKNGGFGGMRAWGEGVRGIVSRSPPSLPSNSLDTPLTPMPSHHPGGEGGMEGGREGGERQTHFGTEQGEGGWPPFLQCTSPIPFH